MASELQEDPMAMSGESSATTQMKSDGKSWRELRTTVKDTRKLVSSLASRVPSSFTFRTVQTEHGVVTRLYFLGIPPKQRESTLLYTSIPHVVSTITPTLQWCSLLEQFNTLPAQMSREEQLLRERKRDNLTNIPYIVSTITPTLQWCSLLEQFNTLPAQMSREEQLLRERKRDNLTNIPHVVSTIIPTLQGCSLLEQFNTRPAQMSREEQLLRERKRDNLTNIPHIVSTITPTLQGRSLLEQFNTLPAQMSREEQLLRERKRYGMHVSKTFPKQDFYKTLSVTAKFEGDPLQKAAANHKMEVIKDRICVKYGIENIETKEETAGYQHPAQMSREEQLLRERKRLGIFGITSYEMTDSGKFVFPACNSLFTCMNDNITTEEALFPMKIETNREGARMDPKICPTDSNLVAFVNCNDLFVVNTKTGQEVRLTHSNKGTGNLEQDPISSGVPSFVVQEEFGRYTGYWWEPVQTGSHTYRILYEEVDESGVDILQIYSPAELRGIDEYRYPRPGTNNAKSCLKMVEFTINADGQILENTVIKTLYQPLNELFPMMEYLIRAGWTPDSKYVYCEVMNRQQTKVKLVLIPVECFVVQPVTEPESTSHGNTKYPPIYVILEDESKIWVNVHDNLHFLPNTSDQEINFIWLSERSGYWHLYRVKSTLPQSAPLLDCETDIFEQHEDLWRCDQTEITPITQGDWEVSTSETYLDKERQLIYFIGRKDSVLETHLYVTSYSSPGDITRLTEPGYSHTVSFNKDCSMFVDVYSSVSVSPMSTVYKILHSESGIKTQPMGILLPSAPCTDYIAPELFNYKSKSGYTMHGMYYLPHNRQPGVVHPTVLFVYAGPHAQLVSNSFKGLKYLRLHTLASQGYAVVAIDGRGSCYRGLKFESHIKYRMGTTEIEDQVEGLQWLMSQVDFIDESRIAIHGWSYGGYISLMGLAQRPDVFKVAIAGAPVVDWKLYDTGYTERYMDLPDNNTYGYQQGCVLSYVDNFPDDENRLLIVHGLIDENVHFQHTIVLVNALIKACKPHLLQVYPHERHGIRNHEANEHYKTMMLSFLQKNL